MTPLKGTDPKLSNDGVSTRGMIREGMGNKPMLGNKTPKAFSDAPLPTSGKMVSAVGGPR
jgi:hypothetical protein